MQLIYIIILFILQTGFRPVDIINPLTSQWEVVTVFTYPYLSAGAPELGEAKGLIDNKKSVHKSKSISSCSQN